MALNIPQILSQFKADVTKALAAETVRKICAYLVAPGRCAVHRGRLL